MPRSVTPNGWQTLLIPPTILIPEVPSTFIRVTVCRTHMQHCNYDNMLDDGTILQHQPERRQQMSVFQATRSAGFLNSCTVPRQNTSIQLHAIISTWSPAATLWWFTATPKPLKIQVFWGSPSPQRSYSPYILGDTTRPGHVTCVLVWSKSGRRRLRKTLHKQTDKQTDTTKIIVTWPWTNYDDSPWLDNRMLSTLIF